MGVPFFVFFFVATIFVVFVFEMTTLPKAIMKIEDMRVLKCICQRLSIGSPNFKRKQRQEFKHVGMCSRHLAKPSYIHAQICVSSR